VSKSNALTGLRLGWALAPDDVASAIVKVHAWLTSCTDSFAQQVALHIFTSGSLDEHFAWYRKHQRSVVTQLEESGLRFIYPEGSFYACVRLADGMSSLEASHTLADRYDTIAIPGVAFGACFEGWLRLSWVSPAERVREGLSRIAEYARGALV
ncbi:MAG: aminotransferase class I/II-fold pyridoxal phosphate-dependent enzyme, partial [Candidatus Eremiobacteraeota bacterium]|nr:aminotransferase class I/II-fold pyridoxal phosphate-dependent enzyme [Candidatus Eremiobacteraeota bacterium]